ncbi:MAG: MoaD/ThiS family protein [Proteobacteria bacterium]|nr:MoaD/ThiS family protein [Pseudomonadota bacterium]
MRTLVNGAERKAPPQSTLVGRLGSLGVNPAAAVAGQSGLVVPREQHAQLASRDRDCPEIVRVVGGG